MTFLVATPAAAPVAVLDTYRMPETPRLVHPAPVPDPALTTTATRHEVIAGQLFIDGKRACPFCFEDAGTPWCRCNPIAETAVAERGHWRAGR